MSKLLKVTGLVLVFLYLPQVVWAQVSNLVNLSTPHTESFPVVSSYLEVRDGEGNFVTGLSAGEVIILENDQRIAVDELTELEPGVQFVVAINPGTNLAIRDSQGRTRYDFLVESLAGWALQAENGTDDLSLVTNGVQGFMHLSDPAKWVEALYGLPSDHRNSEPNTQAVLSQAINVASETSPRAGMGRAVLFITPYLERDVIPMLEGLGVQAKQNGVRVFVWMVASDSYFTAQSALALQQMAFSTGGDYFAYSGVEPIPDIEPYLEPLRSIYFLTYSSKVTSQGEHLVAVEVNTSNFQLSSAPQSFTLDILPPNPILVSPPADLYRSLLTDARNNMVGHTPDTQPLEILIEFPDGYERPLARTTLYVNGQIMDENTAPPFDKFNWNLSGITKSGEYVIQVEAVDSLGLSSITLQNTVNVTVQELPQGIAAEISRQGSVISAVVVLISGSVLVLALVMVIRRRHDPEATAKWKKRKPKRTPEPITRPSARTLAERSKSRARPAGLTEWASNLPNRLHWPSAQPRTRQAEPVAYLERVYDPNSLEALTPTQPIAITSSEIILGTDPAKATFVLEEPSVASIHAQMRRDRDGNFFIKDNSTVAGTWINYAQTNGKEVRIEHGDLLHLGRVGFRFKINNPPKVFEPVILFEQNVKIR